MSTSSATEVRTCVKSNNTTMKKRKTLNITIIKWYRVSAERFVSFRLSSCGRNFNRTHKRILPLTRILWYRIDLDSQWDKSPLLNEFLCPPLWYDYRLIMNNVKTWRSRVNTLKVDESSRASELTGIQNESLSDTKGFVDAKVVWKKKKIIRWSSRIHHLQEVDRYSRERSVWLTRASETDDLMIRSSHSMKKVRSLSIPRYFDPRLIRTHEGPVRFTSHGCSLSWGPSDLYCHG